MCAVSQCQSRVSFGPVFFQVLAFVVLLAYLGPVIRNRTDLISFFNNFLVLNMSHDFIENNITLSINGFKAPDSAHHLLSNKTLEIDLLAKPGKPFTNTTQPSSHVL